jgi:hypothetical protein
MRDERTPDQQGVERQRRSGSVRTCSAGSWYGRGRNAERMGRVFDGLEHGEAGREREFGGLSLGMTNVRGVVEAHAAPSA